MRSQTQYYNSLSCIDIFQDDLDSYIKKGPTRLCCAPYFQIL